MKNCNNLLKQTCSRASIINLAYYKYCHLNILQISNSIWP